MADGSITREELFALVWAEPLTAVARRFGVSDVAVGKACRRHAIPLPGRGHWAKSQYGHAPTRPMLPALMKPGLERVHFHADGSPAIVALEPEPRDVRTHPPDIQAALDREASPGWRIHVGSRLSNAHPIVVAVRARWEKYGRLEASGLRECGRGDWSVNVSPGSGSRVWRLLNAFARAAEARGFEWEVSAQGTHKLWVLKEAFVLRFGERTTVVRDPTGEMRRRLERQNRYVPARILAPTGELRLFLKGEFSELTFSDRSGAPLEDRLNDVMVAALERVSEWRRRKAEQERAEFVRAIRVRMRDAKRRRLEMVRSAADEMLRYDELVRFVERAELLIAGGLEAVPKARRLVRWCRLMVDRADPVRARLRSFGRERQAGQPW